MLALLLTIAMQTAPPISDDPVVLEEQAFAAIEGKQWCMAMRLFEKAHGLGPAIGLLTNAARAAELAGDLEGAAIVHEQAKVFATATKAQRATSTKKATELRKQAEKSGTTACPALSVLQPPPPPPVVEPAPVVEAAVDEPRRPPPPDLRVIGFTSAGVGGALVVGGAVVGAIGLLPWFAHADAVARIQQAERDRTSATGPQADQALAREAWDGHGRLLTIAGSAAVGVGVAVVVGGLVVALTAPATSESP